MPRNWSEGSWESIPADCKDALQSKPGHHLLSHGNTSTSSVISDPASKRVLRGPPEHRIYVSA